MTIEVLFIKIKGHFEDDKDNVIEKYIKLDGSLLRDDDNVSLHQMLWAEEAAMNSVGPRIDYDVMETFRKMERRQNRVKMINNVAESIFGINTEDILLYKLGVFDCYEEKNADAFFEPSDFDEDGDYWPNNEDVLVWFPTPLFWFVEDEYTFSESKPASRPRKPMFLKRELSVFVQEEDTNRVFIIDDTEKMTEIRFSEYSKEINYSYKVTDYLNRSIKLGKESIQRNY